MAAVVTTLVSACGGAVGDEAQPPETSAEPTPSATPSPSPAPGPPVLTVDGLGYIRLDEAIPSSFDGTALVEWDADYCHEGSGAWVQLGRSDSYGNMDLVVDSQSEMTTSTPITSIVVHGGDYVTDAGISVGSSEDALVAAYPSAAILLEYDSSRLYQLTGAESRMQFITTTGLVSSMAAISDSVDSSTSIGPTDWYFPCS